MAETIRSHAGIPCIAAIARIIDDSIDVHRLLTARLRSEPFEIINASSGRDGLRMAKECEPSLVLLDLDMPEIDGFEVLRQLKENPIIWSGKAEFVFENKAFLTIQPIYSIITRVTSRTWRAAST